MDLGSEKSVSGVKISWEAAYASQFQVQVSTNNSTWTTVYENYNATGGTQEINFNAVSARYVKLYCIKRATSYGFSVYEFEVYGAADAAVNNNTTQSTVTNVAYGKTATATSTESNSYVASYAVDANGTTRWSSSYADNQNFIVDLGSNYSVSSFKISWEAAYASQYQIQVSTDNNTWTTVYENYNATGGTQTINIPAATARYVKVYCIKRATVYGFSMYEFEVYGTQSAGNADNNNQTGNTGNNNQTVAPSNENLALQKQTTTSSTETSSYGAANAVDGNGSTRWSSSYADNQNLVVDLGAVKSVSRVKISWEAAYASQYQIQTSSDNATWTTVYQNNNATGGTQEINFATVNARYVKLNCIKRATVYGFSVYEFEVYSNANGANTPSDNQEPVIPSGNQTGAGKDFKVVGYLPDWYGDIINNVQLEKYTHVNYAFAIPDENGSIRPLSNSNLASKLVTTAHSKNVKVLISVGGWSYNNTVLESTFVAATNTDQKCRTFANNIINLVEQYGFDGADIDWEYPRSNTSAQYEKFMTYLYQGLSQRNKLLTAAVVGSGSAGNAYPDSVLNMMDFINVMAYDGNAGSGHSPYSYAVDRGNYWINTRHLPAEKVIIGVPFYERPNWASYKEIVAKDQANAYKDSTVINGTTVYYNGLDTIAKKTRWAGENAGGIMVWEMSQDSNIKGLSLLDKICQTRDEMFGGK